MLTAKIKQVQLIVIRDALSDKNNIFFLDLKITKKLLIFPLKFIIINKNINDHKPLWKTISIEGTNLISLKNKGWGSPQNTEAKTV